ncbi:acyl carrier protein [Streptomyces fumanus]|uniref:Acyl carrier protein n=1 Tax=Streptomyces fumanus TaxID=67302 RepID=A0A919DVR3_9ACTN|nr:acyl carrier protein [Streptomyces fumanus]GHE84237.1 acyl carrier protein [Streptomyces fumanus]
MSPFTLEDLTAMVAEIAGAEAARALSRHPADAPFTSLGFDSMTVIELAERIQERYGVPIPDEAVHDLRTVRRTLDYVNDRAAVAAADGAR